MDITVQLYFQNQIQIRLLAQLIYFDLYTFAIFRNFKLNLCGMIAAFKSSVFNFRCHGLIAVQAKDKLCVSVVLMQNSFQCIRHSLAIQRTIRLTISRHNRLICVGRCIFSCIFCKQLIGRITAVLPGNQRIAILIQSILQLLQLAFYRTFISGT